MPDRQTPQTQKPTTTSQSAYFTLLYFLHFATRQLSFIHHYSDQHCSNQQQETFWSRHLLDKRIYRTQSTEFPWGYTEQTFNKRSDSKLVQWEQLRGQASEVQIQKFKGSASGKICSDRSHLLTNPSWVELRTRVFCEVNHRVALQYCRRSCIKTVMTSKPTVWTISIQMQT